MHYALLLGVSGGLIIQVDQPWGGGTSTSSSPACLSDSCTKPLGAASLSGSLGNAGLDVSKADHFLLVPQSSVHAGLLLVSLC